MPTQQDLVNDMYQYPVEVLEKLHVIASSIILPTSGQLTSVDFASMVNAVFKVGGLADTYFPTWTDRGKSDFGRFLVEIFALFSDKDMFYINHFYNESFAQTAELYKSIVWKARQQGVSYVPSKSCILEIILNIAAGSEEVIPRGAITLGASGVPSLQAINLETTIETSSIDDDYEIVFVEGKLLTISGEFNGRSIVLDTKKISAGSIELTIAGEEYLEVETFSNGTSTSKHFIVEYNEYSQAEIFFPTDAAYGVIPAVSSEFSAEFIVSGSTTLVPANYLDIVINSEASRAILGINQSSPSTPAVVQKSLEELRYLVLSRSKNLGRAVSLLDTEMIARELPYVYNVKAVQVANYRFLFVVTQTGAPTSGQISSITDYIQPKSIQGISLVVSSAPMKSVTMTIDVYVTAGVNSAVVQNLVSEQVRKYLDPTRGAAFGEGVSRYRLNAAIVSKINTVQNVVFTTLYYDTAPSATPLDLFAEPQELIDYDNSTITINIIGGV